MNSNFLEHIPIATKTLLGLNIAIFVIASIFPALNQILALHYFASPLFKAHQTVTHVFMHSGLTHLLFNMYALAMFGSVVEKSLGTQKFCLLYVFSAIGAFILHMGIIGWQLTDVSVDILSVLQTQGAEIIANNQNYTDPLLGALNIKFNAAMVGASGAIMGLLVSFGILYPNAALQLIFLPIPIKAKFFIPIIMLIDLLLGVGQFEWDNIAHFAHLGGAITGALLLLFWIKKGDIIHSKINF
jgi:membrane associated rhomboid family serine protease